MRRLIVFLALAAVPVLGGVAPTGSAQYYDPYGGMAPYGGAYAGGYGGAYGGSGWGYGGYTGAPYAPGGAVGPLSLPGPLPYGPYGAGGYAGVAGYGGAPYGSFPYYGSPVLSGVYNATGYPTFGLFPYLAANGNTTNPSNYTSYQPYAFFMGCGSTYTGSNYYVCR